MLRSTCILHTRRSMAQLNPSNQAHPVDVASPNCLRVVIKHGNYVRTPDERPKSDLKNSLIEKYPRDTIVVMCTMCGEFFFIHFNPFPSAELLDKVFLPQLKTDRILPTLCVYCEEAMRTRKDAPCTPYEIGRWLLRRWATKTFADGTQMLWQDRFPFASLQDLESKPVEVLPRRGIRNMLQELKGKSTATEVRLPSAAVGTRSDLTPVGTSTTLDETFLIRPPPSSHQAAAAQAQPKPLQARQPPAGQQQRPGLAKQSTTGRK